MKIATVACFRAQMCIRCENVPILDSVIDNINVVIEDQDRLLTALLSNLYNFKYKVLNLKMTTTCITVGLNLNHKDPSACYV